MDQPALRRAVVDEARSWAATPYVHQGRLKGVGVDCGGLVIEVGRAVGVMAWSPNAWAPFAGYGRAPVPTNMRRAIAAFLNPIGRADVGPGDVAWIAWRAGLPMHLAIVTDVGPEGGLRIIHALSDRGQGIDHVVEHGLEAEWIDRVHGWWRYPGLAAP
jgi:cell wall-associated NlpC family hydrolase